MKVFRVVAKRAGPTRVEQLMGREFRVFPAVLVREQVLQNNLGKCFLPADEIARSVDAWNNMPVVIRHPTSRGVPISARQPDVLNQRGVGFVFRARFEGAALKADIFVDQSRIADVPDADVVVNAADDGQTTELSTGFATNAERTDGKFDGHDYELVLRDIEPDHLALLPDEIGACSVEDGCGLGVNRARPRGKLATMARRLLGLADSVPQSDEDRRSQLWDALMEKFGGPNRAMWIESVFSEQKQVVFHLESMTGVGMFRTDFTEGQDGAFTFTDPVEVRRVTVFEPVANNAGTFTQEERIMDRKQMIAHLVAANVLTEAALNTLTDCQLAALVGNKPAPATQAAAPAADAALEEIRGALATLATLPKQVTDLAAANTALAATVTSLQARATQEEAAELEALRTAVLGVQGRAWTDDEVKAMDLATLRKVHQTLLPAAQNKTRASFVGRGGPRATAAAGSFDFAKQPIIAGNKGESVLDAAQGGN